MRLWEIFRFEVAYQLRRPLTWVLFAALFAFILAVTTTMFATSARGGGYTINGPFVTALGTLLGSAVALIALAAFAGDAAARDAQTMMHPLVYTSPVAKATYLGGRFLGAFAVGALLLAAIPLALLLAVRMPGVDPSLLGPFRPSAYLGAYVTIALGNALAASALFFAMAALSRRAVAGYLGAVLLFVTTFVCSRILGEELGYWEIGKIFDPLGFSVLTGLWTTTTPLQKEALSVGLHPPLLLNRAVWLGVAACALALTYFRFRFAHAGTGGGRAAARGGRGESPTPEAAAGAPIVAPRVARSFGGATRARQTIAVATQSFRDVATSWGGLVLGLMAALLVLLGPQTMDHIGVPLLPTTVQMLGFAANTGEILWAIVPMVAGFYVGELVWRDRETRLSEISDAAPVPEWVRFLGRFLGIALLVVVYQALLMAACMLVQMQLGYYDFEVELYARVFFGILLVDHLLFVAMAFSVHAMVNQKYVGHIVALALYAFSASSTALGVEHRLIPFAAAPDWSYTEMRGFGGSLAPWAWFKLYWGAWALLLAVLGTLFWVRGKELGLASRLASARERLTRTTTGVGAAALALIVALGGFVFYNTNVLNAYATQSEEAERKAEYERRYGHYEGVPQPRLASASLRVEIYPERREAEIHGTYRLVNASDVPIDSIHLAPGPGVETGQVELDRLAELVLDDERLGHRIYALKTALQPGASMRLGVRVRFAPRGFTNDGIDPAVAANGTFIDADGWLPAIGYQKGRELDGEGERAAHGLPRRPAVPPLEDAAARGDLWAARHFDFEAVVGTAEGQVAVAPGALRETWAENGRRYFHYATDAPIDHDVAIFSAAYAVREARWSDVAIEIFHHPAHAANVDRMVASVQASLGYYTRHFGPYPYRQIRLVERPSNGFSLHAGPGNISYEEGFSFFDPGSDPRGFDFVFAVVAHEVAHQWWAGQLRPAYVEGAPVLSESLAWYSAMAVMEEAHGPEHLRRLLDTMREAYVNPRARAGVPLLRARDWFTSYRKGPFAMYALREYVGAERVNVALRRLLEKGSGEAPLQTSLDLYAELRAVAPESLHPLLADLFEANTYWELETKRVTARPTGAGEWEVTLDVKARKVVVDEEGAETEVPMDDLVEIGVFAAGEDGAPGDPLSLAMRRVHSGEQRITVTVPAEPAAAGIDPRNLLIDVQPGDNVAEATRAAP